MIRRVLHKVRRLIAGPAASPGVAAAPAAEDLLRLVNDQSQPNLNALWAVTKDLEALRLNVKMLGYSLAAAMEPRLQNIPIEPQRGFVMDSKACTQADIESRWFRYWCEQLKERPRFHRKLWEYAYLMQALNAAEVFTPGARVLGLGGVGQPIPSYLARMGAKVVVAQDSGQPLPERGGPDPLYDEGLVDRPTFARQVERRQLDLDALPGELKDFDALWSIGCVPHRGSIDKGAAMIRAAMGALKPGGIAVHIVEFNFADDERTIDNWGAVLFQRAHLQGLCQALKADGHDPAPFNFNVGFQEMDRFVDLPPYDTDRTPAFDRLWRDGWQGAHLKAMVDGFICTSFGLIVRKAR